VHALLLAARQLAAAAAPGAGTAIAFTHSHLAIRATSPCAVCPDATFPFRQDASLDEETVERVLHSYERATQYGADSYKAWHAWALMNFTALSKQAPSSQSERQLQLVVSSLKGAKRTMASA
jgi:hypothetical protein